MTNRITFTIIAASLLLAACSQDDTVPREELPAGKQTVCFSAGEPTTTRTEVGTNTDRTLTIHWAEADEVGIYGRNDGRSSGDNYAYTATPYKSDATRCSFSASDTYELFTWTKNAAQSYYAYYPYTKVTDRTPNPEAHPFSLPALQTQSEGNSPAHIARYGLMTAAPVNIPAGSVSEGAIQFSFANVFSIVELRFKMTADCAIASVPVKQVRLLSDAAALAIPAGTIDLTRAIDSEAELPVVIGEGGGSQSLALTFDTNPGITKTDYVSTYLVAAPGTHPAGTLRLEVTAIDNSTYSYTIPEQVVLRPNRHYTQSYELSLDEFVLSDEFEAKIPSLNCKAGEPLTVSMTGIADRVDFWSGEEGHDYAYAEKDRMQEPDMTMNFMMLLNSGTQRTPTKVKYSADFDGTMTEEGILAATWHDVSSQFDMTTYIYGTDTKTTVSASIPPHNAGIVDCSEWFTGQGNSCYIAFFYHIDKYDADYTDPETGTAGNGRTYFYLHDMWVRARYKSESSFTEIYRHKYVKNESNPEYPTVVLGATFGSEDGSNPINVYAYGDSYPYVLRLGAAFRPTVDKDSYLVMPKLTRPEAKNVGKDSPFVVKDSGDEQPASYQYTFTAPGIYEVAVVGTVQTLAGEKQILLRKSVTVTE